MAFPGTLTVSPVTLQQLVRELVASVYRHGWRRVFVLTGHGGNNSAVDIAVSQLRGEYSDLHIAWSGITAVVADIAAELAGSGVRGHSCEIETSQALFVDPTLVYADGLRKGSASLDDLDAAGRLSRTRNGIHFPQAYDSLSVNGNLGDARLASVDAGARLVQTAVDRIAEFLEGFAALPDRKPAGACLSIPPGDSRAQTLPAGTAEPPT